MGTSGAASVGFRLAGGEPDTLQQYINQRVEIRGTFQNEPSVASTTPGVQAPTRTLRIRRSVRWLATADRFSNASRSRLPAAGFDLNEREAGSRKPR
jgi:hypothetical protein